MDIFSQQNGVYIFGPFRLDPVRRSLLRDGVPVKLGARLFGTLLYLVENHGRLVQRDELLHAVWQGRSVEDCNLGQAIFGLRKELQAGEATENYIVTVAGRGYRFAAPVAFEPESPSPAAVAPVQQVDGSAKATERLPTGRARRLLAAALMAGISAALWRFSSAPRAPGQLAEAAFAPPPHSLAVLAFRNLSGDPSQEYFSDGISEELINALGRAGGLRLAAATSAFSFKGKPATIGDIARHLNVSAVLEGSVRRDSTHLRISADLIDATTGYQLWANSYDRNRGDIFAIQEDIAEAVATSLKAALTIHDVPKLALGGTTNPKAYDAYLRGLRSFLAKTADSGDRQAITAFDEAISLDPKFATAHVDRALAQVDLVEFGWEPDVTKARHMLEDALSESNNAISIAPGLGWAYAARASVELNLSFDFAAAAADYAQGQSLSPGNPWIEIKYAVFEMFLGHFASAAAAAERARSSNPMDIATHLRVAETYFFARRFDEARAALNHAETMGEYGLARGRGLRGFIELLSGDAPGAARDCAADLDIVEAECTVISLHALGRFREAETAFAKLRAMAGERAAYNYAEIYAQWGQQDEALRWLSRAFDLRDNGLLLMKVDPLLDPIRNTRVFKDIERKMRFPV